ncbi:MAG: hypothetical protein GDA52_10835 [Rhodobacteraceae bacterium]|nr:hypothetical protein [Paracoccaceae bacterium]
MSTPDIHSIARQLAVLEERMNTQQADYRTGWEAIRANMAEHQRDYRTSIADLKADIAKRDKDNQRFLITLFGLLVAIIIGGFVVSNIFL